MASVFSGRAMTSTTVDFLAISGSLTVTAGSLTVTSGSFAGTISGSVTTATTTSVSGSSPVTASSRSPSAIIGRGGFGSAGSSTISISSGSYTGGLNPFTTTGISSSIPGSSVPSAAMLTTDSSGFPGVFKSETMRMSSAGATISGSTGKSTMSSGSSATGSSIVCISATRGSSSPPISTTGSWLTTGRS